MAFPGQVDVKREGREVEDCPAARQGTGWAAAGAAGGALGGDRSASYPGLGSFHLAALEQIPKRRGHLGKERGPFADLDFTEEAGAAVPRRVRSLEHPPPLGQGCQADPDGTSECAGQVRHRGVHADDQIELHHRHDVFHRPYVVG
jgi:hypothetical protein